MTGKRWVLGMLLAFALAGCAGETSRPYSGEMYAVADQLARQETAEAQGTRSALEVIARGTSDALALEEQATRQAQNLQATQAAMTLEATIAAAAIEGTRQAQVIQLTRQAEASIATSTAQAEMIRGTATAHVLLIRSTGTAQAASRHSTATARAATATSQAVQDNAQATAVQATSVSVALEAQREQQTSALQAFAGWCLLFGSVAVLLLVGYYLLPIVKARLTVVKRRAGELEPFLVLERDRIRLPMRAFDVLGNVGPSAPWQDRVSGRAQLPDVINAAARGGGGRRRLVPQRPGGQGEQWEQVEQPTPQWPTRIPLTGILDGAPSVRNLALGVTVHDDGKAEVVRSDMSKLVHVAVGGSSGWGKSVFLQSLAYQLAQSTEPVDLAMVDLEAVTFAPFARCGRLLWPVADTERDALAIFQALGDELNRRKELFGQYPGVADLWSYNRVADEPLHPVVVMVDEATALLSSKDVHGAVKTIILRARKFGLWAVLGGQDWKASSLDTTIRNQIGARVQFKAMDATQSRVLLHQAGAEQLDVAGRALAILPGRGLVKLQSPIISHSNIITAIASGGPRQALPEVIQAGGDGDQGGRIRQLAEEGLSKRRICLEVFGYTGGKAFNSVTDALRGGTTTTGQAVQTGSTA